MDVKREIVDIDTLIPCGLILCEGITNFLKYGITSTPKLEIKFIQNINERVLLIKDNGPGFPKHILDGKYNSLGFELIHSLTEQIGDLYG
ncbi:MAG: sensor histidine kinase [Flavobacteriales bacterium]|nr:sensor histidine kinase [Flavobacteriales bacterium]